MGVTGVLWPVLAGRTSCTVGAYAPGMPRHCGDYTGVSTSLFMQLS